jgi:NAD(P)H-flavin reductase
MWRYYSPANAPREDGTIELHIQLVPGGLVSTSMLRSLRAGDTVRMGAPIGDQLVHSDDGSRGILMVAGGTGLAPLRAILEQIDRGWEASGQAPHVQLFHGVRVPWSLYEHERLTALAQRPWFDYTPVVSDDSSYRGTRGLVGSIAAQSAQRDGRRALVCGSGEMVQHTIGELTKAGTVREDIRFDEFATAGLGSGDME